jgi:multidrug efflux pump subunit AcrA (membrane-fusion protein)
MREEQHHRDAAPGRAGNEDAAGQSLEATEPAARGEAGEPVAKTKRSAAGVAGSALRFLLVALVLAVGIGGAVYFMRTRPQAQRRRSAAEAVTVRVQPIRTASHKVVVRAMGTVQPARRVMLAPRVAGQVVKVAGQLVPGGRFDANDPVVWIDLEDYHLAVQQQQTEVLRRSAELERARSDANQRATDVTRAECAEQIEMGQQAIAQREYELLGKDLGAQDRELVLRRPQLRSVRAATEAARAAEKSARAAAKAAEKSEAAAQTALARARLDLSRTTVRAPFNALVIDKSVDVGSQVSAVTQLATLVGTDEYWVEVSVPVDELKWLALGRAVGENGSKARVYYPAAWGDDANRVGHVMRPPAVLEPQGRMARLLVTVPDPLCLKATNADEPAMILSAYVRVELYGRALADVAAVPRSALRDGDRVWIMTQEDELEIRSVGNRIVRRDEKHAYVAGALRDGECLVTSDIGTPVRGMKLRVQPTTTSAPASDGEARP